MIKMLGNWKRRFVVTNIFIGVGALTTAILLKSNKKRDKCYRYEMTKKLKYVRNLPDRGEMLSRLKSGDKYDVVVIGGGATGCGIALDAVSRGLKTALVEMNDYSSGTSSKSTKLIHGGVRYLQKAIMSLDYKQFMMVREALSERANLLEIAPHLAVPIPIILPLYKLWHIPYYWLGIKMYDFVSLTQLIKPSYFMSKKTALEKFPMLKEDELAGAIVYYDGQHDDSRMCLAMISTSIKYGADALNYCCVESLIRKSYPEGERISGVKVKDNLSGDVFDINANVVINATGAFVDTVRTMDNKTCRPICRPSSGTHIVLPEYYSPSNMGLLDPSTKDGRVVFLLPWQNATIAGTTDTECELTSDPAPSEKEINFILNELRHYFDKTINIRRGDVLSAWCGIRPLVIDPNQKNTEALARNHIIQVSDSNLVTISGGKWTTYRQMAEETIGNLKPNHECVTKGLLLDGSKGWTPLRPRISLIQDLGIDCDVAQHLSSTYGMRALEVVECAEMTGKKWPILGKRLHENYPYVECEIHYAIKQYATSVVDVISRRIRVAYINVYAAMEMIPRITQVMGDELKWDIKKREMEMSKAIDFLKKEMGMSLCEVASIPDNLSEDEIGTFRNTFKKLDRGSQGYLTYNRLSEYMSSINHDIRNNEMHIIFNDIDLNKNGQIDINEFLQFMGRIKSGSSQEKHLTKTSGESFKIESGDLKKRKDNTECGDV